MKANIVILAVWLCCIVAQADQIRIAIVGTDAGAEAGKVLDLAMAGFKDSKDIEVLERAQIDRVLREQEFSLGNRVPDAERAVKAGQLLRVDLFVVLEGGGPNQPCGVVVFDAQSGVRYADSAVTGADFSAIASAVGIVVQRSVAKLRERSRNLLTLGVLSVRNADLARSFDPLCDTVALLLERNLIAAPGLAVLERRRLEHINRERGIVTETGGPLLPSLRMLDLEIARNGDGLRASVAVTSFDGQWKARTNASVTTMDAAALAERLAEAVAQLLQNRAPALPAERLAEARRFGREGEVLTEHRDYAAAVRAMEAAGALDPTNADYQVRLVKLLPNAAIEIIDPGGQRWHRSLRRRLSNDELALALAFGHRAADLLRDFCMEAVATTKPVEPAPDIMSSTSSDELSRLIEKLADPTLRGTAAQAEMDSLCRKERDVRIEIIEPFHRSRVRDKKSFDRFSWNSFSFALNDHLGAFDRAQWQRDGALVTRRWLEVARKFNPPDGSGNYAPLSYLTSGAAPNASTGASALFAPIWEECANADDPVLRAYGKFGRVMGELKAAKRPDVEQERRLRLWLEGEIARLPVSETNVRPKLFNMIEQALFAVINHPQDWEEYLAACRFALQQHAARPGLFNAALSTLSTARNNKTVETHQLAADVLKFIDEQPEAFSERDRNQTADLCRQYRDRFAPLSAQNNSVPPLGARSETV